MGATKGFAERVSKPKWVWGVVRAGLAGVQAGGRVRTGGWEGPGEDFRQSLTETTLKIIDIIIIIESIVDLLCLLCLDTECK